MNWLLKNAEIVGTAAGFLCVWLTVRQNIWNWPLGLVNNLFFLVVLAQDHLYANVGLMAIRGSCAKVSEVLNGPLVGYLAANP